MSGRMECFLERVREVNNGLDAAPSMVPFIIDGDTLGHLMPSFARELNQHNSVFKLLENDCTLLTLADQLKGLACRSAAVAEVLQQLRDDGLITGKQRLTP